MEYTKAETKIVADFEKLIKKKGWQPMETKGVGGAWFGGKSHKGLQKYIPEEKLEHFEDIDFLVMGWADDKESENE